MIIAEEAQKSRLSWPKGKEDYHSPSSLLDENKLDVSS
jgi:hypothetical protein